MSQFAKDVAKQLDRRQRRRRRLVLGGAAAAIVLAVLYLRCGRGWGLGGSGSGTGSGATLEVRDAGPHRCAIRVAAQGTTVDGVIATRDQVLAACKATAGADVVVTGDARQGDWDELRAALDAAHIPVFVRER